MICPAYEHSTDCYTKVLSELEGQQGSTVEALQKKARYGLNQNTARLDNAHDIYRNIFWPVWWITEADQTAEWYDDVYMLAIGNSMEKLLNRLDSDIGIHQVPVLIQANFFQPMWLIR